jgi:tetratricopeptide (TPR) repeat protein
MKSILVAIVSGLAIPSLAIAAPVSHAEEYPPALLQHFMTARNLTDRDIAEKTVDVKERPDVDLDGKRDYLVQLRRSDNLCIYEVYRSSADYAYSGEVACCKWTKKRSKDHLDFVCRDAPSMDTDKGVIAWRPSPWSYGDASATPNPAAAGGQEADGMAALKAGKFREARKLFGKAILNSKPTAQLKYEYALAVKGAGEISMARMALYDALILDPKFEPALLADADWYWDEGNKGEAVRAYKDYLAVAKDPAGIERARKRTQ